MMILSRVCFKVLMGTMKKLIVALVLFIILISCKNQLSETNEETLWVYIEVGIEGKKFTDFLYGQILKKDINFLKVNSDSEKLFFIKNVRIIGDDDIVKDISLNSNETGSYFYRVKEIKYLEILKKDPIHLKVKTVPTEN